MGLSRSTQVTSAYSRRTSPRPGTEHKHAAVHATFAFRALNPPFRTERFRVLSKYRRITLHDPWRHTDDSSRRKSISENAEALGADVGRKDPGEWRLETECLL